MIGGGAGVELTIGGWWVSVVVEVSGGDGVAVVRIRGFWWFGLDPFVWVVFYVDCFI